MIKGMYGSYGGQYAPETLMVALNELEEAYAAVKDDPSFQEELAFYSSFFILLCEKDE